jgi:hypothetical protein
MAYSPQFAQSLYIGQGRPVGAGDGAGDGRSVGCGVGAGVGHACPILISGVAEHVAVGS